MSNYLFSFLIFLCLFICKHNWMCHCFKYFHPYFLPFFAIFLCCCLTCSSGFWEFCSTLLSAFFKSYGVSDYIRDIQGTLEVHAVKKSCIRISLWTLIISSNNIDALYFVSKPILMLLELAFCRWNWVWYYKLFQSLDSVPEILKFLYEFSCIY